MNAKFDVHIRPELYDGVSVYLIERRDGQSAVASFTDTGHLLLTTFGELDPLPQPTMRLNGAAAKPILDAFMAALSLAGHEPDSTARVKGELDATKLHLQDMRRLVFDPVEPTITLKENT